MAVLMINIAHVENLINRFVQEVLDCYVNKWGHVVPPFSTLLKIAFSFKEPNIVHNIDAKLACIYIVTCRAADILNILILGIRKELVVDWNSHIGCFPRELTP